MQFRKNMSFSMGRTLAIVVLSVVTLSACSSSDDDADDGMTPVAVSESPMGDGTNDLGEGATDADAGMTGSDEGATDADAGMTGSDEGATDTDAGMSGSDEGATDSDAGTDGAGEGGEDSGNTDAGGSDSYAFVSGATPTFDAGQIERLTLGDNITSSGAYPATLSDIVVRTDNTDVYQVGRFNIDSITRFTTNDLTTPVYQYSVLQGEASPNTTDIVFASETKAYVLQAGGTSILIVNPSAASADEFITGSLDISAYDDDAPDAVSGLVVDGKLFVLMQRLTTFNPINPGYVAVFDTATDTEIATGMNNNGLNGIELSTLNPSALQYVASSNDILVTGRGNIFVEFNELPGDPYSGGIEAIDVQDYSLELLVDDGTEDSNNGFFTATQQASDTRGYIITSAGYQNNTLRSYDVATGLIDEGAVAGLEGMDLINLAVGPAGRLWVGVGGTEPGFVLIDPANNAVVNDKVNTQFIPNHIVFVEGAR